MIKMSQAFPFIQEERNVFNQISFSKKRTTRFWIYSAGELALIGHLRWTCGEDTGSRYQSIHTVDEEFFWDVVENHKNE